MKSFSSCVLAAVCLFLASCAGTFSAGEYARDNGFQQLTANGEWFSVVGFLRGSGEVLRVYIEGDGRAWLSRRRPSSDPTPTQDNVFRMAATDDSSAVLYLARPCQYVAGEDRRNCMIPIWTSARFSEPVVADMSRALDIAKVEAGARRLELIGFSGGGAVAVLLADRRDDVDLIVTIAGNLDHAFWTRLHGLTPLMDSLNPAEHSDNVSDIRQIHIVSLDDEIIPPSVVQSYAATISNQDNVSIVVVEGTGHYGDWSEHVNAVLSGLE